MNEITSAGLIVPDFQRGGMDHLNFLSGFKLSSLLLFLTVPDFFAKINTLDIFAKPYKFILFGSTVCRCFC